MPYPPRPQLCALPQFAGTARTGTVRSAQLQSQLEAFVVTAYAGGWSLREIGELVDPGLLRELLQVGAGAVVTMTLAPETAHLHALLDLLAEASVVPSFGHTDATAAVTTAAVAAVPGGQVSATHLFNGMPPVLSRTPGPVLACLAAAARGDLVVELVGDGVHLADDTVAGFFDLVGADQVALVTDAMAAAGMPDGDYVLGPLDVDVRDGVARLAPDPAAPVDQPRPIAGGTARLVEVLARTVHAAGVPLSDAVTAATATPARLLGRSAEIGRLAVGLRADLLVTDAALEPRAVMRAGAWCPTTTSTTSTTPTTTRS